MSKLKPGEADVPDVTQQAGHFTGLAADHVLETPQQGWDLLPLVAPIGVCGGVLGLAANLP